MYCITLIYVAFWLHIYPHCFTKHHHFQKHVNKHKMCVDFLYRKNCTKRTDRQNETNSCFPQFSKVPNSYNMHVPKVRSSKGKDQPITCHHRHSSISPFILNLGTRQGWAVNNTLSHFMPRKEPPTDHCNECRWATVLVYTSTEKIKSLASTVFWTPQYVSTLTVPSWPLQSPISFKWTINHCSENLFSGQPDHVKRWL